MNAKHKHDLRIALRLLPRLFLIFGSLTLVMFALFDPTGKRIVRNARTHVAQLYGQVSAYIASGLSSPADSTVAKSVSNGSEIAQEVSIEELTAPTTVPDAAPAVADPPVASEAAAPPRVSEEPRLTLEDIIRAPQRWPRAVTLRVPVVFPAVVNGRVAGNVTAPAGAVAKPLTVQSGLITVQYQGGTKVLPLASTDFAEQVERMLGSASPDGRTDLATSAATASGTAPPGNESTSPSAPAKLNLLLSTERKRFDVERTKTLSTQNTVESWGYAISVVNKSFADIPEVEIRYQMIIKDESPGTATAARQRRKSGAKTCELLKNNTTFAFDTEPVELTKTQLASGYVYGSGARARSRDSLVGVMVRAYREGKVVAEFSEPPALRTKEKWEEGSP